jgi:hypothetical protein
MEFFPLQFSIIPHRGMIGAEAGEGRQESEIKKGELARFPPDEPILPLRF